MAVALTSAPWASSNSATSLNEGMYMVAARVDAGRLSGRVHDIPNRPPSDRTKRNMEKKAFMVY